MNLRTVLLVATLALAADAVRAQELQISASGQLCSIINPTGGCGGPSDFTTSFIVSTPSAQIFPEFESIGGTSVLFELSATLAITSLSGEFGGQPQPFVPSTSGVLQLLAPQGGTEAPYNIFS